MSKATQEIALSKKGKHIVVSETTFDKDGFGSAVRRGIIPIDPERDADEMLELAQERSWKLSGEVDINGFYAVEQVKTVEKGTEVEQ